MSKPRDSGLPSALARLSGAQLERVVQQLAPESLHQLIRHCGIDACAEIVTATTPAQLTRVLDLDLFQATRAGGDEQFDAYRFGEWIEALAAADPSAAAAAIARMDPQLVVAGLSRHIRVFDLGTLEPTFQSDDEPHETMRAHDDHEFELVGLLIRGRRDAPWDAIVDVLTALESEQPAAFRRITAGCRAFSDGGTEDDGLDDLLDDRAQLVHEVTEQREHRRSKSGFSTAADARAFLDLARAQGLEPRSHADRNPLATAYFRATDDPQDAVAAEPMALIGSIDAAEAAAINQVHEQLADAGLIPDRPRALLAAGDAGGSALATIQRQLALVGERDAVIFLQRGRELTFLANTLVAGCSVLGRPLTPGEASDAALATCNLGLERWESPLPDDVLIAQSLIPIFERGWAVLHDEVSLPVCEGLMAFLRTFRTADRETQQGLDELRRELKRQRDAGTPWKAGEAIEAVSPLDLTVWSALLGLLSECPVAPQAMTAIVERWTRSFSSNAFTFISTDAQIAQVHEFVRRLPALLG